MSDQRISEIELVEKGNEKKQNQEVIPHSQHILNLHEFLTSPRYSQEFDEEHTLVTEVSKKQKIPRLKKVGLEIKSTIRDTVLNVEKKLEDGMVKTDIVYHKFKGRDRSDSMLGAVFNFVNSTIGAGILSLPFILKSCGILIGIPLIILGGLITLVSLIYLYNSHELALDRDPNIKDYENVGYLAYGWIMSFIIKISIIGYSYGALVSYVIIISDFTMPIWKQLAGSTTILGERWLAALIIIVPLFLISLIKRMGDLRWISYLSFCCCLIFVIFLISSFSSGSTNAQKTGNVILGQVNLSMFRVLGIIIFAFSCHTSVCPINYEFKRENHSRVKYSIYASSFISCMIYIFTAIFGYLCFLDGTNGNLLKSFDYSQAHWYNTLLSAVFCLTLCVTYPLVCFPLKLSLDNLFSPLWRWKIPLGSDPKVPVSFKKYGFINDFYIYMWNSMETIRFFFITMIVCAVVYVSAIFIPNVDIIFSIVGSTAGSLLGYIIPVSLYLKLTKHPWRSWRVIFSIFALIFSILVAIFVTIVTILQVANVI